MFNQYEPNVKATICFLKQLKVTVNNSTVNETLQNHPDWPGLLCITDSLNKWNIPNGVGKIAVDKIDELPVPFIAYTYDNENPLAIIAQVGDKTIQTHQKGYNKIITKTKEEFIKKWDGVYLIAEPNEHSGEVNYAANKQQAFLKSLIPALAIGALTAFSFLLLNKIAGTTAFFGNRHIPAVFCFTGGGYSNILIALVRN
jgi:ABC-type bacteriocin/lantibiotic exporter with double-glycine peptidase domain